MINSSNSNEMPDNDEIPNNNEMPDSNDNSNNNNNTNICEWVPDVIFLGPAGAKGYLELGLLKIFEEENYIQGINNWRGCSAGAVISLLYISNYTVPEIIEYFMDLNIINSIDDINMNINETPGLLNAKSVENLLKRLMIQKFGIVPTMMQLYMATGVNITFVTYNVDKMETEYLSKDTTPQLSSVKAVMMSSAMPGILTPVIHRGYAYADGAIGDPYSILSDDNGVNKILGIYIDSVYGTQSSDKSKIEYIYRCYIAPINSMRIMAMKYASDNCKHIGLKTSILDSTGITLTREDKINMIDSGYETGRMFLNRIRNPDKYRILLDETDEIPNLLFQDLPQQPESQTQEPNETTISVEDFLNDDTRELEYITPEENQTSIESLLIPITPDIRMNIERVKHF